MGFPLSVPHVAPLDSPIRRWDQRCRVCSESFYLVLVSTRGNGRAEPKCRIRWDTQLTQANSCLDHLTATPRAKKIPTVRSPSLNSASAHWHPSSIVFSTVARHCGSPPLPLFYLFRLLPLLCALRSSTLA